MILILLFVNYKCHTNYSLLLKYAVYKLDKMNFLLFEKVSTLQNYTYYRYSSYL